MSSDELKISVDDNVLVHQRTYAVKMYLNTPLTILSHCLKQRLSELENKIEALPKRAWTEKDQQRTDEMLKMIDNLLLERWIIRILE
ncbi:hypothetical protein Tco_1080618 [Tanacetum coccineum]|uniref:Uncharacterized protein n=1 Tax=Tanacetum coccineum TaxID=301880 RepID=A0ABQ5HVB1_9ASTR